MKHAEGFDQAAIEEDPFRRTRPIQILLNITAQDLTGERNGIRARTFAARKSLRDDGSRRLVNRCVAQSGELGQECCLARTWPACDDDMGHRSSVSEDRQLAELNQPRAVALDEPIFGAAHRGRDHPAVLVATHGLPV